MGKESAEIKGVTESLGDDSDLYLGRKMAKREEWVQPGTVIRYFSGSLDDEADKAELEHIMTKSLQTGGLVRQSGDIFVINEAGSFDKEGCYQVVVKYLYMP